MKEDFEELVGKATKTLNDYLDSTEAEEIGLKRAKVAQGILSAHAKLEQVKSARETTAFCVARELSENREQLARFLRIQVPQLTKGLPDPEKIEETKQ